MRSYLVVAVAVLAFLGVVAPPAFAQAPAPKVTVEGFLDQTTAWSKNVSCCDTDLTRRNDSEWYGRTRGRFQITGEVGKTKGVFTFEQDNYYGNISGIAYGFLGDEGRGAVPVQNATIGGRDGTLNSEYLGNVEMLWMYTEFPVTGAGSLLPFVPMPGTLRLGILPFENDTYKLGVLAFGNYAGAHSEIDLAPGIKSTFTYAQIDEASRDAFPGNHGDDFATIFTVEVSPFKGLDVKPIFSYAFLDGTSNPANNTLTTLPVAYGPRQARGGVGDNIASFPAQATEDRFTLGLDAKWKMGAWSLEPTVFYQWGTREMVPSVPTGKSRISCGGPAHNPGASCVEQDMNAWFFDVRGGWTSGPLTLEGMFVYATGNSAEQDLRSGRTVNYYQPIDVNAVYAYQWGTITAIQEEYFKQLNYLNAGMCPACGISYDKYGSIRLGARANYAVTPAFKLRGVLMNLWTAEEVDTLANATGNGLTPVKVGAASRGTDNYMGTEVDLGFDWNFAPNVSFLVTYGHLFVGDALNIAGSANTTLGTAASGVRNAQDVDLMSAVVRYIF